MAIPITEEWEGSICTGSVFHHDGVYYAFYAVRRPDYTQHLAVATGEDGVHFAKQGEFYDPPAGYDPLDFRDPKVFRDPRDGRLRMLVTARLEDGRDGCIAQLRSSDARNWELTDPFLVPGRVTDCPDYFEWNGWHYLLAEHVYWMAPDVDGPWVQPDPDRLDVLYVPKTAEFGEGRRVYASWLPEGGWGGDLIFRELIQLADGRLGTRFAPEVMPPLGPAVDVEWRLPREGVTLGDDRIALQANTAGAEAGLAGTPTDFRLTLEVEAKPGAFRYGLDVGGAELRITPTARTVEIVGRATIRSVEGLDGPFSVEIYRTRDIVDVCIGGRRTVVTRVPPLAPASERVIRLFADHAEVEFRAIGVRPML
jgi:hypothetical protein